MTKKQNPYDVQAGQEWKAKDKRRKNKLVVIQTAKTVHGCFAFVENCGWSIRAEPTRHTWINLLNFDRYVKVK